MPEAEFSQGEMTHFEGEFFLKKVRFFRNFRVYSHYKDNIRVISIIKYSTY